MAPLKHYDIPTNVRQDIRVYIEENEGEDSEDGNVVPEDSKIYYAYHFLCASTTIDSYIFNLIEEYFKEELRNLLDMGPEEVEADCYVELGESIHRVMEIKFSLDGVKGAQ